MKSCNRAMIINNVYLIRGIERGGGSITEIVGMLQNRIILRNGSSGAKNPKKVDTRFE